MSRKRKHGTATTPMTFSTEHHAMFTSMKRNGINVSEWIDSAISYRQRHFAKSPHWTDDEIAWDAVKHNIEMLAEMSYERWIMIRAWAISQNQDGEFSNWTVVRPTLEAPLE